MHGRGGTPPFLPILDAVVVVVAAVTGEGDGRRCSPSPSHTAVLVRVTAAVAGDHTVPRMFRKKNVGWSEKVNGSVSWVGPVRGGCSVPADVLGHLDCLVRVVVVDIRPLGALDLPLPSGSCVHHSSPLESYAIITSSGMSCQIRFRV